MFLMMARETLLCGSDDMIDPVLKRIREQMLQAADARFADGVRRFFKEPVDPIGVRTVDLQRIVRLAYTEVKDWPASQRNRLCNALWKGGKLEEGVLAAHLYRRFRSSCGQCEWKLFERWIDRYVHNWAHCDAVASWLLAACIGNVPSLKAELPAWTRSGNLWKRRAAAVALLQEAKHGRSPEDILRIASITGKDEETMVQKGAGWLLKVAYAKRPETIVEFLREVHFPRLVVRYAAEKMTPSDRAAVLGS
jgi:3-methyladenine DNA glycosylase AlkD